MAHYLRSTVFTVLAAVSCSSPPSQRPPRIVLDGVVDDWAEVPVLATGDAMPEPWARLWATHDEFALLVRLEVPEDISLQVDNALELCLDTDNDPLTGEPVDGFGAELCWAFGERRGRFTRGTTSRPVEHQDIGLISAPTVTGRTFEVALARNAEPAPGTPLFGGETVGLVLRDTESGRRLPTTGGFVYAFAPTTPEPRPPIPLTKQAADHIRVLSYNLNDHLTEEPRAAALGRILRAVGPDVMLLQEIRSTPTVEAAQYVFGLLGVSGDEWYVVKVGGESSVVLSPYPILQADSLGESGAVLLEVGPADGQSGGRTDEATLLLVIVLSAPCCNEYAWRAQELDHIMSYVRDARGPGGDIDVPAGTPILMMGDANLVGLESDRRTLTHGQILDQATYGAPFLPDWDDTPFTDLVPPHTHRPYTFTWHGEDFPPGRLDYVIYGDSQLEIGNHYVLYTPEIPLELLRQHGLEAEDTDVVTDHLPLVVDLILVE